MNIQAVLFDKKHWNATDAREWLHIHNLTPMKPVHKTEKYLRYRIRDPVGKKMRTISLGYGIKAIIII